MSRPRKTLFYESTTLVDIPPGQEWLTAFDYNSHQVVDYLYKKCVGNTIYYSSINCLEKLRYYLLQQKLCYSAEESKRWYEKTGPYPKGYQTALYRLHDIYDYGMIQSVNAFPVVFPYYANLTDLWKKELDNYLGTLDHKDAHLTQIRNCISRFLYRIQLTGFKHPSEISYDFIEEYLKMDKHRSLKSDARYTYSIGDILIFMADRGLCTHGIGWYPYFWMHEKILRMEDLTDSQIKCIESTRLESINFSVEEFTNLIPGFIERFQNFEYSKSPCNIVKFTLYNILVFLEMHKLGYHPDIASVWLEHKKISSENNGWKQYRRILDLFELYTREGDVIPEIIFRKKALLCDKHCMV